MRFNGKVALSIIIVVILAIVFFAFKSGKLNKQNVNESLPVSENTMQNSTVTVETQLPAASSNINSAVSNILSVSSAEQGVSEEETGYETASETQSLNEFGQSYVENEL